MAKCRKCGDILIIGKNWTEGRKNNYRYLCTDCSKKETYILREKNPTHYAKVHREYQLKWKRNMRMKIEERIGNKCRFCGFQGTLKRRISAHEIHGNSHSETPTYILNHSEDFVPLCKFCHRSIHFCMRYLGLTWNDILQLMEKIKNV